MKCMYEGIVLDLVIFQSFIECKGLIPPVFLVELIRGGRWRGMTIIQRRFKTMCGYLLLSYPIAVSTSIYYSIRKIHVALCFY